jgi:hypothetical protein
MKELGMTPDDPTTPRLDDEAVARLIERAGPRPTIPATDLDAIAAAAQSAWRARSPGRAAPRSSGLLALAASLVVLAIGLVVWWAASRQSGAPIAPVGPVDVATMEAASGPVYVEVAGTEQPLTAGQRIAAGARVRTSGYRAIGNAPPARAALRMESGSIVRLDVGTTVRLASATRLDLVRGALYADTGLDPGANGGRSAGAGAALEVHTSNGIARDVGTRFMVRLRARADGPELEVLVRDGAVAVVRGDESDLAAAGEQLMLTRDGELERRAISPHGPDWEWVMDAGPPFTIEGRTVGEILDWVARETGWTVRYEDEALAEDAPGIVVQGGGGDAVRKVRANQAPFVVLPIAGLEGVLDNGVLVVRRPSR